MNDYQSKYFKVIGDNAIELFKYIYHEHGLSYEDTFADYIVSGGLRHVRFLPTVPNEVCNRLLKVLERYIPMDRINSSGFQQQVLRGEGDSHELP